MKTPAFSSYDWHNAPVLQFVITLKGKLEFKMHDNSTFIIEPGDVLIANDLTGSGHQWKLIEDNFLYGDHDFQDPRNVAIARVSHAQRIETSTWKELEFDFELVSGKTYDPEKEYVLAIVMSSSIDGARLIDRGNESTAAGESLTAAESTTETIRAATVMVATLPILAGYPFIQKYLVKGTMVGAVKG